MANGDFVITPNWEWHDHGNTSHAPIFWLDGLDIPLVQFLDASFAEPLGEDEQPVGKPEGDSLARYGANMLPVGYEKRTPTSPIFNYPYERSRDALEQMRRTEEWDSCHGLKMRYVNPVDGGWAMPTIGAFLQLLPRGLTTTQYRSTDATVYVPVEGSGRSVVGGRTFEWEAARRLHRAKLVSRAPRTLRGRGALQLLGPSPCRRSSGSGGSGAATSGSEVVSAVTIDGVGFSVIGRLDLIEILCTRAEAPGATIRFSHQRHLRLKTGEERVSRPVFRGHARARPGHQFSGIVSSLV